MARTHGDTERKGQKGGRPERVVAGGLCGTDAELLLLDAHHGGAELEQRHRVSHLRVLGVLARQLSERRAPVGLARAQPLHQRVHLGRDVGARRHQREPRALQQLAHEEEGRRLLGELDDQPALAAVEERHVEDLEGAGVSHGRQ
eukprot:510198-Rhodomonas_salina.3